MYVDTWSDIFVFISWNVRSCECVMPKKMWAGNSSMKCPTTLVILIRNCIWWHQEGQIDFRVSPGYQNLPLHSPGSHHDLPPHSVTPIKLSLITVHATGASLLLKSGLFLNYFVVIIVVSADRYYVFLTENEHTIFQVCTHVGGKIITHLTDLWEINKIQCSDGKFAPPLLLASFSFPLNAYVICSLSNMNQ